ncbi:MAG: DMT family transporter [Phycisphaerales bacterium]|nr:DMT family transporter [Phycisphaerales bacterium]
MRLSRYSADALLLLAAFIWGVGFVAQRVAMDSMAETGAKVALPLLFTGIRYSLGAMLVGALLLLMKAREKRVTPREPNSSPPPTNSRRILWIGGLAAGSIMFLGSALQQIGLVTTTAGNAGFITGLYVIFVPFLCALLGQRLGWHVWVAASAALIGLYLLSVVGKPHINTGDIWVLACAVVWSAHVIVIGWAAPRVNPLELALIQMVITGVLGLIFAFALEPVTLEAALAAPGSILFSAVFAVAIAFTLQVVGQAAAPPAHAAILMSLESVFAAASGWACLDEHLGVMQLIGSALMLGGAILVQTQPLTESRRSPS